MSTDATDSLHVEEATIADLQAKVRSLTLGLSELTWARFS